MKGKKLFPNEKRDLTSSLFVLLYMNRVNKFYYLYFKAFLCCCFALNPIYIYFTIHSLVYSGIAIESQGDIFLNSHKKAPWPYFMTNTTHTPYQFTFHILIIWIQSAIQVWANTVHICYQQRKLKKYNYYFTSDDVTWSHNCWYILG